MSLTTWRRWLTLWFFALPVQIEHSQPGLGGRRTKSGCLGITEATIIWHSCSSWSIAESESDVDSDSWLRCALFRSCVLCTPFLPFFRFSLAKKPFLLVPFTIFDSFSSSLRLLPSDLTLWKSWWYFAFRHALLSVGLSSTTRIRGP